MKINAPPFGEPLPANAVEAETAPDVRHHIRYPLRAAATFTWFGQEGTPRQGKGTSRNIGETGAYVVTKSCPTVGAPIILVFRFANVPGLVPFRPLHLEMSGQVVRAELVPNAKGMWGFAVNATWTVIQESEESDDDPHSAE